MGHHRTSAHVWAYNTARTWVLTTARAIELLKLDVEIHPDSSDALTSLADAYRLSGQKPLAVGTYNRALEKASLNADAKAHLDRLVAETHVSQAP